MAGLGRLSVDTVAHLQNRERDPLALAEYIYGSCLLGIWETIAEGNKSLENAIE